MSTFARRREDRYFEDYAPGADYDCGRVVVAEAEMLEFARRYDPQAMHVDAAAANDFGGLIASGWLTTALVMRLYVDHYLPGEASLASPGVDELRWALPVRPGDTLHARAVILDATASRRRPDRGVVRARVEARNQHGEVVLSLIVMSILRKRNGRQAP